MSRVVIGNRPFIDLLRELEAASAPQPETRRDDECTCKELAKEWGKSIHITRSLLNNGVKKGLMQRRKCRVVGPSGRLRSHYVYSRKR
jgi:hypothetical protein